MRLRDRIRMFFTFRGVVRATPDLQNAMRKLIETGPMTVEEVHRSIRSALEPMPRNDCDEVPPTTKEVAMPRKDEKTSKRVSTNASAALRDPKASAREKSLAGSALTQTPDRKRKPKTSAKPKPKKRAVRH